MSVEKPFESGSKKWKNGFYVFFLPHFMLYLLIFATFTAIYYTLPNYTLYSIQI